MKYVSSASFNVLGIARFAYIVKGAGIGVGVVLEEEARNRRVFDVVAAGDFFPGNGAGSKRQDSRQQRALHLGGRRCGVLEASESWLTSRISDRAPSRRCAAQPYIMA